MANAAASVAASMSHVPIPMPLPSTSSIMPPPQDRPIATIGGNLLTSEVYGKHFGFSIISNCLDQSQMSSFDGPAAKRARLEDSLEPEELWTQKINGPVNLAILAPVIPEWNLDGQTFGITSDVRATVSRNLNIVLVCNSRLPI
jgi:hypothetical protein